MTIIDEEDRKKQEAKAAGERSDDAGEQEP